MIDEKLIAEDLRYIWHPCSQMKEYEDFKPLIIKAAKGSYLELMNGKKIIDAISSWWCKSFGHGHPRLKHALLNQIEQFEHVILANTTNSTIVKLGENLATLCPNLNKSFFASDGSSAIEIAMKMSLHTRKINGNKIKTKFMALQNGYHGETAAALSVSDLTIYKNPYQEMLFDSFLIKDLPYVQSMDCALWHDCKSYWFNIEKELNPLAATTTAIILEPIVQGAAGMKIYSQDFLRRLRQWTLQHDIHLIADEIMTGIGRTGHMLAIQHAGILPDFICLSKGLTGGWLPLSAVVTTQAIYDYFYQEYDTGHSFLHSHTYSGNALAAAIANEVFKLCHEINIGAKANELGSLMLNHMRDIAADTGKLKNIRSIGAIVAADLDVPSHRNLTNLIYQKAAEWGALLRPLGNTLYWLPPLTTTPETLEELSAITLKTLRSLA